jgi:hypothetical protein
MAGMVRTAVLPDATPVGPLPARLRRSRSTAIDPLLFFLISSVRRGSGQDAPGHRSGRPFLDDMVNWSTLKEFG